MISSSFTPVSLSQPALQTFHNYNPFSKNSNLDPITGQIIKTQDAALELMRQIENGTAGRMWEEQKKIPLRNMARRYIGLVYGLGKILFGYRTERTEHHRS